ncbi:histone-lysine N-methyltransferase SETMAR-like [Maniola hyperantus]|uniref:histone-lysine N-methyltransferase SETMAR-like n=1 Tax=Aphantopus hyperantus TaxID=2795564 RepID=UPI0037490D47
MDRFTGPQRAYCVKQFYLNNFSLITVRRLFRVEYGLHDLSQCPSAPLIKKWVKKFEETGSTLNVKQTGGPRTSRSEENVQQVSASVRRDPDLSTRKRSAELGLSRTSLRRILKLDLKLHPYKIQLVQELNPNDLNLRKSYAETMLTRFSNFHNILFSDEAHFHLNGHVNKQNCRYWSSENPKAKHERPLHSPKVTVWAAISAKGIIGPYFFEDSRGRSVTVNSAEYVKMLREFLAPMLLEFAGYNRNTWFQQDGATCHTSNESLPVVKDMFPEKLISRRGDIPWPPRSPDLSPADFFLWGYLKSRVYIDKPNTLRQLKEKIIEEMSAISRPLCRRVFENFRTRLDECKNRNGGHLDEIIFKK